MVSCSSVVLATCLILFAPAASAAWIGESCATENCTFEGVKCTNISGTPVCCDFNCTQVCSLLQCGDINYLCGGYCNCSYELTCSPGHECENGQCYCSNTTSCPNNTCCDPRTLECVSRFSNSSCGVTGDWCDACNTTERCIASGTCCTTLSFVEACVALQLNGSYITRQCGLACDGCDTNYICGSCTAGEECDQEFGLCSCNGTSCPSGCCDPVSHRCLPGNTTSACGFWQNTCQVCMPGQVCSTNTTGVNYCCTPLTQLEACDPYGYTCGTVPDGCGGTVFCGTGTGQCVDPSHPVCQIHSCFCNETSCLNGCCDIEDSRLCVPGINKTLCGSFGSVCQTCNDSICVENSTSNHYCCAPQTASEVCWVSYYTVDFELSPMPPMKRQLGYVLVPRECGFMSDGCVDTVLCGNLSGACPSEYNCREDLGLCVCNETSCTTGCCDPITGKCVNGTSNTTCGSVGDRCYICNSTEVCTTNSSTVNYCCEPLPFDYACVVMQVNGSYIPRECGIACNGCGGDYLCGICGAGHTCDQISGMCRCSNTSCPNGTCCNPDTLKCDVGSANATCGSSNMCNTCNSSQTCFENSCCQSPGCDTLCLGFECGMVDDECGSFCNCGVTDGSCAWNPQQPVCQDHICRCNAISCGSNTCCDALGGQCLNGTFDTQCGNGTMCENCSYSLIGDVCSTSLECCDQMESSTVCEYEECGFHPDGCGRFFYCDDCAIGYNCVPTSNHSVCRCNATSCPNGCCNPNFFDCVLGTADGACGAPGTMCSTCPNGYACAPSSTVPLNATNGTCVKVPCGSVGQICCNHTFCDPGAVCLTERVGNETCVACGELGMPCCDGYCEGSPRTCVTGNKTFNDGSYPLHGTCSQCAADGYPCCSPTNSSGETTPWCYLWHDCNQTTEICFQCGGIGQQCCMEGQNYTGCEPVDSICGPNNMCVHCGNASDPCCLNPQQCDGSLVCIANQTCCQVLDCVSFCSTRSCGEFQDHCGGLCDCNDLGGGCDIDHECNTTSGQCYCYAGSCSSGCCNPVTLICSNDYNTNLTCGPLGGFCDACNSSERCVAQTCCAPITWEAACSLRECGNATDGCGITYNCGSCPSGEACNVFGICVCNALTCSACCTSNGTCATNGTLLQTCGVVPGELCSVCTPGTQVCIPNQNHTNYVCCTLKTFSEVCSTTRECGTFPDGCGSFITCGSCDKTSLQPACVVYTQHGNATDCVCNATSCPNCCEYNNALMTNNYWAEYSVDFAYTGWEINCFAGNIAVTCGASNTQCHNCLVDYNNTNAVCMANQTCCLPKSVAEICANAACGLHANGCGSYIQCGNCSDTSLVCLSGYCACPPAIPDNCSNICTNIQTDNSNCGACGLVCNASCNYICVNGTCRIPRVANQTCTSSSCCNAYDICGVNNLCVEPNIGCTFFDGSNNCEAVRWCDWCPVIAVCLSNLTFQTYCPPCSAFDGNETRCSITNGVCEWCGAGICAEVGACTCNVTGARCCAGVCNGGLICAYNDTCVPNCGQTNGTCCFNNLCSSSNDVCWNNRCTPKCSLSGMPCCPANETTHCLCHSEFLMCASNGTCMPCGQLDDPCCCVGPKCTPGTTCSSEDVCAACGDVGERCCDPPVNSGSFTQCSDPVSLLCWLNNTCIERCTPLSKSIACTSKQCGSVSNGCYYSNETWGQYDCGACVYPGQMCVDNMCRCNATSCPGGCCNNLTQQCMTGNLTSSCGIGGQKCAVCSSGQVCAPWHSCCLPSNAACGVRTCGTMPDGCGGIIGCGTLNGTCPTGYDCLTNKTCCYHKTVAQICGVCNCGNHPDSCGRTITCGTHNGTCPSGHLCLDNCLCVCNATRCALSGGCCNNLTQQCMTGNLATSCGSNGEKCAICSSGQVCSPSRDCCSPNISACGSRECGTVSDGCGGVQNCGSCPSGQLCMSGGVCACNASSGCPNNTCCDSNTRQCISGHQWDACGIDGLMCTICLVSQACTIAGQCCTPGLQSTLCAGKDCGIIFDSCNLGYNCGNCTTNFVCNASYSCTCTPMSIQDACDQDEQNCGMAPDGCGNMVPCGTCATGQTCNAGTCTCDATLCSFGCCDSSTQLCMNGTSNHYCGASGLQCTTCAGQTPYCVANQCVAGSESSLVAGDLLYHGTIRTRLWYIMLGTCRFKRLWPSCNSVCAPLICVFIPSCTWCGNACVEAVVDESGHRIGNGCPGTCAARASVGDCLATRPEFNNTCGWCAATGLVVAKPRKHTTALHTMAAPGARSKKALTVDDSGRCILSTSSCLYGWLTGPWSMCSPTCARTRDIRCIVTSNTGIIDETAPVVYSPDISLCDPTSLPTTIETCSGDSCLKDCIGLNCTNENCCVDRHCCGAHLWVRRQT